MSESEDGLSVAATRQNAGRLLNVSAVCPPLRGVNAPAATVSLAVIVTFGSFNDVRLSHVAPWPSTDATIATASSPAPVIPFVIRETATRLMMASPSINDVHQNGHKGK